MNRPGISKIIMSFPPEVETAYHEWLVTNRKPYGRIKKTTAERVEMQRGWFSTLDLAQSEGKTDLQVLAISAIVCGEMVEAKILDSRLHQNEKQFCVIRK